MVQWYIIVGACAAGLVALFVISKLYKCYKEKKLRSEWNKHKGVVIIHGIKPAKHSISLTPFALKLETFFRMMDIQYVHDYEQPMGPKSKVPWITLDGVDYSDSQFITEMLIEKFKKDPDKDLTDEQRALGLAMRILFEDHVYWGFVHWRYVEDEMKGVQSCYDPSFAERMIKPLVIYFAKKALYAQGFGRHSNSEVHNLTRKALISFAHFLGDKNFMFGDQPHLDDCAIYGMLNQLLTCAPDNPYETLLKQEHPQLLAYTERMQARFWPDWDKCIARP